MGARDRCQLRRRTRRLDSDSQIPAASLSVSTDSAGARTNADRATSRSSAASLRAPDDDVAMRIRVPSRLRATLFEPRGACARFVRILSRHISSTNGVYDHSLRMWVPCALRLVPATSGNPDARNIGTPCDRKCDQRDRTDHENHECSYEDFQHDRTHFQQRLLRECNVTHARFPDHRGPKNDIDS